LSLSSDILVSNFAFTFKLYRYTAGIADDDDAASCSARRRHGHEGHVGDGDGDDDDCDDGVCGGAIRVSDVPWLGLGRGKEGDIYVHA
jgi:hypothetical protein